jgi:hypothetical protein
MIRHSLFNIRQLQEKPRRSLLSSRIFRVSSRGDREYNPPQAAGSRLYRCSRMPTALGGRGHPPSTGFDVVLEGECPQPPQGRNRME